MSDGEPTPKHVVTVHEIREDHEVVVFSGFLPEAVFADAGAWLYAQRRLSTGWTVIDTDWFFKIVEGGVDADRMQYHLTLRIARRAEDGVTGGEVDRRGNPVPGTGTQEKMVERLVWPPTTT